MFADVVGYSRMMAMDEADKSLLGRIQVPTSIETYTLVLQGQQKIFKYDQEQNSSAQKYV